jgi:hypothetical protein
VARWKANALSMNQLPTFARWTNKDEANLILQQSDDINIKDMHYGHCLVALKEQELLAMLDGMIQEKKDMIRRRLDKMLTDLTTWSENTSLEWGDLMVLMISSFRMDV